MPRQYEWVDRRLDGDVATGVTLVSKVFDPDSQARGASPRIARLCYGRWSNIRIIPTKLIVNAMPC